MVFASKTQALNVLSKWIYLDDLINFDTAICSSANRSFFLKLFQLSSFVFDADWQFRRHVNWISLRGVGCSKIHFALFDPFVTKYLCVKTNQIQKLTFSDMVTFHTGSDMVYASIINSCPLLLSLTFENANVSNETICKLSPIVTEKLTCLVFNKCHKLTESSFEYLSKHCRSLKSFECLSGGQSSSLFFAKIVENNHALEILSILSVLGGPMYSIIKLENDLLASLTKNCFWLNKVVLHSSELFAMDSVVQLLTQCNNTIQYFSMFGCGNTLVENPVFTYKVIHNEKHLEIHTVEMGGYKLKDSYFVCGLVSVNNITHLTINSVSNTKVLLDVIVRCHSSRLISLGLLHCKMDYLANDLQSVIQKCSHLRDFQLAWSEGWTEQALTSTFTTGYSIRHLQLIAFHFLNTDDVIDFLDFNPRLVECVVESNKVDKAVIDAYMVIRKAEHTVNNV